MEAVLDILSWGCIGGGLFFCLMGGIGLLRFPDFYARCHAAGMTDTLGSILLIAGLMLQTGFELNLARLTLILLFLLFTSPVAGHAIARAAYDHGLEAQVDGEEVTDA
ncbi:MAG: monovalent cation/H(+) antiporter subunit G [Myxococcota bacterium]|nr:monovalent cation/H(+) antiporter subunit G [Myxococcota bacterium]